MATIAPDWLSAPATRRVLAALAPARPLFVGGCVRDALMGRETQDVDIAVTTPPEETMALAVGAGLGAHPTGLDHGVVTLSADGAPFEVATLRRDVATDGRRAVVAFTEDVAEDAARRDFTINALYADGEGRVLDPLGSGLADLTALRVRFIGEAEARIREDYLRILRFFRFHAQFGIEDVDPEGRAACEALAAGLAGISRERIGAEMLKLLAAPDPAPTLAAMSSIIPLILPAAGDLGGVAAAERALGVAPDPLRRLAALGAAPAEAEARLRLSKREGARLRATAAALTAAAPLAETAYRRGAPAATDAVVLRRAAGAVVETDWRGEIERGAAARFPLTGADLTARGVAPGPALGAALRAAEERWIASDFALDAEALIEGLG